MLKCRAGTGLTQSTSERAYRCSPDLSLPCNAASKDFCMATSDLQPPPPDSFMTTLLRIELSVTTLSRARRSFVKLLCREIFFLPNCCWAVFLCCRSTFLTPRCSPQCFERKQKAHSVFGSVLFSRGVPVSPCQRKLGQLCSQACRKLGAQVRCDFPPPEL